MSDSILMDKHWQTHTLQGTVDRTSVPGRNSDTLYVTTVQLPPLHSLPLLHTQVQHASLLLKRHWRSMGYPLALWSTSSACVHGIAIQRRGHPVKNSRRRLSQSRLSIWCKDSAYQGSSKGGTIRSIYTLVLDRNWHSYTCIHSNWLILTTHRETSHMHTHAHAHTHTHTHTHTHYTPIQTTHTSLA